MNKLERLRELVTDYIGPLIEDDEEHDKKATNKLEKKMTERVMRKMLRELVKELEDEIDDVSKRIDEYDPHSCHPQYLGGLRGGYIVATQLLW